MKLYISFWRHIIHNLHVTYWHTQVTRDHQLLCSGYGDPSRPETLVKQLPVPWVDCIFRQRTTWSHWTDWWSPEWNRPVKWAGQWGDLEGRTEIQQTPAAILHKALRTHRQNPQLLGHSFHQSSTGRVPGSSYCEILLNLSQFWENGWPKAYTVDCYLAFVGSQNSRARVKWFSRWQREGADSRIQDHRPTLPGVYNSQTVCWAIIEVLTFPGSLHTSTSHQRQITTSNIRF